MPIPLTDLMRRVVADPTAYADAFPVTERPAYPTESFGAGEGSLAWSPFSDLNSPSTDFGYARLTPEMLEQARVVLHSPPFIGDSVAQRVLDQARNRVEGSYSVRLRPTGHTYDEAQFVLDDTVPENEIRFLPPGPHFRVYGDGRHPSPSEEALARQEDPVRQFVEGPNYRRRPDHYRVHPGRCSCGFTAVLTGDMETHLRGPSGHSWLTVCECGLETYCREVRVPRAPSLSLNASFDPTQGPTDDRVWLCVRCRERRRLRD